MTPQNLRTAITLPLLFDSDAPLFLTEDPETLAAAAKKAPTLDCGGESGTGGDTEGHETCNW